MDYVLIYLGSVSPHVTDCINQIHKVDPSAKIHLCTNDDKFNHEFINKILTRDLPIPSIGNYFSGSKDPLWVTSLLRIFYLNAIVQKLKTPVVHFDCDVLIYLPFSEIESHIQSGIYITQHTHKQYAFGYSVITDFEKFHTLCKRIYHLVLTGTDNVQRITNDHPNEMTLLYHCGKDLISNLPVHPELGSFTDIIFDPSSYGQFIGGTPNGHAPGFVDPNQLIGSILTKNETKIFVENKLPYVSFNGKTFRIANLHIHSKKLKDHV
jgi:hypothetical protein